MDYKYINQLLERYWRCETSLEEEAILKAFFSQTELPKEFQPYKDFFCYQANQKQEEVLGENFDNKILAAIEQPKNMKTRIVKMQTRMRPLFRASAIVAIVLTLGNAFQLPLGDSSYPTSDMIKSHQHGANVAVGDSSAIDSMQHGNIGAVERQDHVILK